MKLSNFLIPIFLAKEGESATRNGFLSPGSKRTQGVAEARTLCQQEGKVLATPNNLEELSLMRFHLYDMDNSDFFQQSIWVDIEKTGDKWLMENGEEAPLLDYVNQKQYFATMKCVVFRDGKYEEGDNLFEAAATVCTMRSARSAKPFFCRKLQDTPVTISEQTKQLAVGSGATARFIQSWIPFKEVMGAAFADAKKGDKFAGFIANPIQKIGLKIFRQVEEFECMSYPEDGSSTLSEPDSEDACSGLSTRIQNMITFTNDYFAKCTLNYESYTKRRDRVSTNLGKKLSKVKDHLDRKCERRINL